jgi:hypothetical protein
MLFRVTPSKSIEPVISDWKLPELELESYIITTTDTSVKILHESIFGEPLLLVNNQVKAANKLNDILALDRNGNAVIIELKRDEGKLGVETQALQYLAYFSAYKGRDFMRNFASDSFTEEAVLSFLGDKGSIDLLNQKPRLILLARYFDDAVFVVGEWLGSKGIAFRCISYQPVQIQRERYLSFSIAYDHAPEGLYPLIFSSSIREPGIFWHNIAHNNQEWWDFLRQNGQIPACFHNQRGDQGEKLLRKYREGDKIIAYAKTFGAIGWGIIENPQYDLIKPDQNGNFGDRCRHRLKIKWQSTAATLDKGLRAEDIRRDFNIYHPVSTSVQIRTNEGLSLITELDKRFQVES